MERAVYLYGDLAKTYGKKPIMINADTMLLVMQGLFCKLGNKFKQRVRDGQFHIYKNQKKKDHDVCEEEVPMNLGDNTKELHLVPVVAGRSATARIIIGVVLLVVGYFFPPAAPYLIPMGASSIFGGVAELLAPKPQINSPVQQAGQNPSFIFNGTVNVTEQGGPVPIILGRMRRAGCVVLSAGLTVENLPL